MQSPIKCAQLLTQRIIISFEMLELTQKIIFAITKLLRFITLRIVPDQPIVLSKFMGTSNNKRC
jgi:hypothetical protein